MPTAIEGGIFIYPQNVSSPAYPFPIFRNAIIERKFTSKGLLPRPCFFTREILRHVILNKCDSPCLLSTKCSVYT